MRVLMINGFHFLSGGAETCYLELSAALRSRGIDVINFSMEHPKNLPSQYSSYYVSHIDFPAELRRGGIRPKLKVAKRAIYSREARVQIERLLKDHQPDLVHIHNFIQEMTSSILPPLKKAGLPVIQTLHDFKLRCPSINFRVGDQICERCKGHRYYNAALQRCKRGSLMASIVAAAETYFHEIAGLYEPNIDLFISPSQFLSTKMREHGVEKEIVDIPNFVDLDRFWASYKPEDYALYVGRLAPGKGLRVLLEAYEDVPADYPLYIAGRGELQDELVQLTKDRALDHVRFLGHLDYEELGSYYRNACFVVLPSIMYENNPMCILEAFASGTASIGSDLGGTTELIAANGAGLLFESGNARELAEKMNFLFTNRDVAIEMGRRGRRQVEENNSLNSHLEKTLEAYRRYVEIPFEMQLASVK